MHQYRDYFFLEIALPKSKPVIIGILYITPDKYDFVNCPERTFSDTYVIETQECYLLGDININLQPKDKDIFRSKSANTTDKEMPHLNWTYLEICFTHSMEQIITRLTNVTDQTATLIDYILTNSPEVKSVRFHRSWSIWSRSDLLIALSDLLLYWFIWKTSTQIP